MIAALPKGAEGSMRIFPGARARAFLKTEAVAHFNVTDALDSMVLLTSPNSSAQQIINLRVSRQA